MEEGSEECLSSEVEVAGGLLDVEIGGVDEVEDDSEAVVLAGSYVVRARCESRAGRVNASGRIASGASVE